MEIRPVRPEEYEEAGAVTRAAYETFFAGGPHAGYLDLLADVAGRATRAPVLVAVEDGVIIGTVTLELTETLNPNSTRELAPDEAHLRMLGVAPPAQGRGVGRALVEACAALARASGKRRVRLSTTPAMLAAQRLYTRMGFGRLPDYEMEPGSWFLSYELDVTRGAAVVAARDIQVRAERPPEPEGKKPGR